MLNRATTLEDLLLDQALIYTIALLHKLPTSYITVRRHRYINNIEIDAEIQYGTKTVGLELKLMRLGSCNELRKALKQALLRRHYFDYFYIVLAEYDPDTCSIVTDNTVQHFFTCIVKHYDIYRLVRKCTQNGVGIILNDNGTWKPIYKSTKR